MIAAEKKPFSGEETPSVVKKRAFLPEMDSVRLSGARHHLALIFL